MNTNTIAVFEAEDRLRPPSLTDDSLTARAAVVRAVEISAATPPRAATIHPMAN